MGIQLSKELMSIAGHSLKANITTLGPLVLPISEQLLFFVNLIARKVCSGAGGGRSGPGGGLWGRWRGPIRARGGCAHFCRRLVLYSGRPLGRHLSAHCLLVAS